MESFVFKVRTSDSTAVAVVAGPVANPYEPLLHATMAMDDEHTAIVIPSGIVDDVLRAMNVLV